MAIVALIVVAIVVLFLIGPRVRVHGVVPHLKIPSDIEQFLSESEESISSLTPGTEKCVIWNNPVTKAQTDFSIVYLHGYSASRQEVSPVCERLAKSLGANLFLTRFSGHGGESELMRSTTAESLLRDAVEALDIGKAIGKQVILIGTSTGATLAAWLALHDYQKSIHSLVMLSPNFGPANRATEWMLLPWGKTILQLVQGSEYRFEPANEQQRNYWVTSFPSVALLPMMALVQMIRKSPLEQIEQPVLVMYSESDMVLDVNKLKKHVARIGSRTKQLVELTPASAKKHVLAGDIMSPSTTDFVTEQIQRFIDHNCSGTNLVNKT